MNRHTVRMVAAIHKVALKSRFQPLAENAPDCGSTANLGHSYLNLEF